MTRHWSLPRILIAAIAVETALGALLFDLVLDGTAAEHMGNPAWPPHAKFHDAQYIVMSLGLGVLTLALLARRRGDTRSRLLCAAGILAVPWAAMFPALLLPGTATYDPQFRAGTQFILGLHGQLFMAAVTLAILAAATFLALPHRRAAT
ncbi:hypothetical protein GCM10010112_13220 [Actinoplanes lobatus]|uniref:Uncharacterized protein n=1 Tax=Actinoplanes lobatus TaxID=113568 RepID=A0A7W7HM90_9ACTN|nr:DUF6640 family protein [Actinoplanes lobatus]MBB4753159.1 hypothetical protein [Actinoplanes lobatus]GGN58933.1 hypothetical protein GCM10010112_13220 [Actinoplanes lobatus]GIE42980.1 hypothetical protein Alo02nite_58780 [Actinoplanes lobatus]